LSLKSRHTQNSIKTAVFEHPARSLALVPIIASDLFSDTASPCSNIIDVLQAASDTQPDVDSIVQCLRCLYFWRVLLGRRRKNRSEASIKPMPAKLPEARIGDSTRHVEDVKVGETVYSWLGAMWIDAERSCFLDPKETVFPGDSGSAFTVLKITRGEDGWDVCILRKNVFWQPSRLIPDHYYPVRTLTEAD
jgi:hypothetical protein